MSVRAVAGLASVLVATGALAGSAADPPRRAAYESPGGPAADAPRRGTYDGPGVVLRVTDLRPGGEGRIDGVRLLRWSRPLTCREGGTARLNLPLAAAIVDHEFTGYVFYTDGSRRQSLVGRFTSPTRLRGRVRVRTFGCDTGPVRFRARRTQP